MSEHESKAEQKPATDSTVEQRLEIAEAQINILQSRVSWLEAKVLASK